MVFVNTKVDLGPCNKRHDEDLRMLYRTSMDYKRKGLEWVFLEYLESLHKESAISVITLGLVIFTSDLFVCYNWIVINEFEKMRHALTLKTWKNWVNDLIYGFLV